jgi:hypothetical protein
LAKALLAAPVVALAFPILIALPLLGSGFTEAVLTGWGLPIRMAGVAGLILVFGGLRTIGRRFSTSVAYAPISALIVTLALVVLSTSPSQTETYHAASSLLSFVPITASMLAGFRFESDHAETRWDRWRRRIGVGLFAFGTFLLTASAGEILYIHS